uniref:dynein regulatory complex protein 1-like n=1 Tax=Monopterus albus TaxID=43700 RepID=UPI0009B3238B|nr:dynein regulatory complex protein 1-like [Monopterus albus]
MKHLVDESSCQEKELTIKDYKRSIQEFENMQKKLKHTAAANSRKYKEMWLMCDAEVNQLAERALVIDSLICKNLGLSWEQPPMAFMECSSPIQPQKQAHRHSRQGISQVFQTGQALQCNHKMMGASGGLETNAESSDMEMHKEGTAVQSESGADVEGEELSMETLNKVMEVLYDEVGFLTEGKPLELLTLLEKEEQTVVKLDTLMSSLGIEEKDVPKLAPFLLKYNQQQTEDVCGELAETAETSSMTNLTSELIDPKHVLPALKSFLEQQMRFRESSAHQQTNQLHLETQDSSEDKAYWESMGNIILEDKLKLWDTAEKALKQYIKILTDISDLTFETKSLEHENTELRMLLQQPLSAAEGKESLVKASRVKKHRKTK